MDATWTGFLDCSRQQLAGRRRSVLVEGGAHVLGSCIDAAIADRAHVFVAPKIVGGERSKTAVAVPRKWNAWRMR